MKTFILLVLLIFTSITFSQNVSHLFELRGLEDSLGNTHLFYRYGGSSADPCWSKSIYHFDITSTSDTLFIPDNGYIVYPGSGCIGNNIFDYEFFENDPAKYIYGGYNLSIDPVPILIRYDGEIQILAVGGITEIEISAQNDSLVYAALYQGLYKSTDGGYNFVFLDSVTSIYNSMISLSKNNDSQIYGIDQNKLVRSEDEGRNYIIVDDDIHWSWNYERELYYDADGQHLYGVAASSNESALRISDNNGNPFTWDLKSSRPGLITFMLDEQNPGEVYYSYNKSIYKSTDFGNSFLLFKELEQKITGMYKKSNTDILYASTKFRIYEITPDSNQVIKTLPIPDEILSYYPLAVGNKWIYDYIIRPDDIGQEGDSGIYIRQVLKDTTMANGKFYAKVYDETLNPFGEIVFERLDSLSGKVYRYFEHPSLENNEFLIHDLLAEVGDTVYSSRNYYGESLFTTVQQISTFNKWGITKAKKVYQEYSLSMLTYSLTEEFGLDSIYFIFDFGFVRTELKGAIINGIVYGDTTVVSVEDETPNLPTEFSLSQNYPNPFNPSTIIKYTLGSRQYATLKVYDVLGNEVATLVNEEKPAGSYEVEFKAKGLPSGIYFYRIRAGSFIQTKKMLLLK